MAAITWHESPARRHTGRTPRAQRPDLRLVHGGRTPSHPLPASVYRRRRLAAGLLAIVVAAVLAAAVVGAGVLVGAATSGSPAGGRPAAPPAAGTRTHVVQPGDTLWGIARSLQPEGDVRPLVDRLAAAHGTALAVGERIELPG